MKITEFQGKNRFLSNFYASPIVVDGIEYPTVEHAYQAAKRPDMEYKTYIAGLRTPYAAKAAGNGAQSKNWHLVSLMLMYDFVKQKFTVHEELKKQLLDTGDADLIEGNHWNDTFWGECPIGNWRKSFGSYFGKSTDGNS